MIRLTATHRGARPSERDAAHTAGRIVCDRESRRPAGGGGERGTRAWDASRAPRWVAVKRRSGRSSAYPPKPNEVVTNCDYLSQPSNSATRSAAQALPRCEIPNGPTGFLTQCVKNRIFRQLQALLRVEICDAARRELRWTRYRLPTETDLAAELQRERRAIEMDQRLRQGGTDE
jgi:hypothetical protein